MYQYVPDNLHTLVWTAMQYFTVDEKLQPDCECCYTFDCYF